MKPRRRYQGKLIRVLIRDNVKCSVNIMSAIDLVIGYNYVLSDTANAGKEGRYQLNGYILMVPQKPASYRHCRRRAEWLV